MRVIAKTAGYFGGARRRVGAEFDMPKSAMKKDAEGKPVLPRWVVPASSESRKELADAKKVAEQKDIKAIEAAAGPKRPGRTAVRDNAHEDLV